MQHARRRPDGTFSYGDEIYRLEEREHDDFAVLRVSDGKELGHLRFHGTEGNIQGMKEPNAGDIDVLRAIQGLLEGSRGILPLQ